jgi:hypothetical protein
MADTKCTGDHSVHICELAQQDKFNDKKSSHKIRITCA